MTPHDDLLEYETVRRWIDDVSMRNTAAPSTTRLYLRGLRHYIDFLGMDPDAIIDECMNGENVNGRTQFQIHKEHLTRFFVHEKERNSHNTARGKHAIARSFYRSNDVVLPVKTPQFIPENLDRVPDKDELNTMVSVCGSALERAILLLSAQSGQRSGVISAITYGMVKHDLEGDHIPVRVDVPGNLCDSRGQRVVKRRVSYVFLFGRESAEALKAYLTERRSRGDTITDDSLLFVSEKKYNGEHRPMDRDAINKVVKRAAVKAGLQVLVKGKRAPIHHHSLRKFYQTAMEHAGISKSWFDYMMGHKIAGLDSSYSRPTLAQLVDGYSRAEPYLSVGLASKQMDDLKRDLLKDIVRREAKKLGIDHMDILKQRQSELGRELTSDEEYDAIQEEVDRVLDERMNGKSYQAKWIPKDAYLSYVKNGWEKIDEDDGKYMVRR